MQQVSQKYIESFKERRLLKAEDIAFNPQYKSWLRVPTHETRGCTHSPLRSSSKGASFRFGRIYASRCKNSKVSNPNHNQRAVNSRKGVNYD